MTADFKLTMSWLHVNSSCYFNITPKTQQHVAAFDLDCTLCDLDQSDIYPHMAAKLIELSQNGYDIVIFSNQAGVAAGKVTLTSVTERFERVQNNVQQLTGVRPSAFFATAKDMYRKPMTRMASIYLGQCERQEYTNESFYCGDAAGRKGDFSCSDRQFAANCGLTFYTPEQLGKTLATQERQMHVDPYADLPLQQYIEKVAPQMTFVPRTCVVLVGPQGAGKSTLSAGIQNCKSNGTTAVLSLDSLKTRAKLDKQFRSVLSSGCNVVVLDCTNPGSERGDYIARAREHGYKTHIYFFDIPKKLCKHLCQMRVQLTPDGELCKHIPAIAQNIYYSKLVPPTATEADTLTVIRGIWDVPQPEYYYQYDLS